MSGSFCRGLVDVAVAFLLTMVGVQNKLARTKQGFMGSSR